MPLPDRYRVKRPVTRRRVVAMLAGVGLVVAAALIFQRGGDSEAQLSPTPRTPLEASLLRSEHSRCNARAGCVDYTAEAVACSSPSGPIEGRRWHRCRVRYVIEEPRAGYPPQLIETSCETLAGAPTRPPLADCPAP